MNIRRYLLASGAVLAAGLATSAKAQNQPAASAASANTIQELVVTAQRREESLQDVPIAVSAFNQDALQKSRIVGGPDLVLAVPNVNFSKSNFTTYNFQIRGIGSKLVGSAGDPGTGVHLNNAPLLSNDLFETEFYDVDRVEVLRGPQGTLYGRNATGGVVNIITAKPADIYAASITAEYGNYNSIKLKGMVNVPLGDSFAFRLAADYLNRDGYGKNLVTGHDADDRDLAAFRATLAFNPTDSFKAWGLWEHFQEDDSRSRIGKQFCTKDPGPANVGGVAFSAIPPIAQIERGFFSQGCSATSLYSPGVLGTVNSQGTLIGVFGALGGFQTGDAFVGKMQTPNIRDIESNFDPSYHAKSDVLELNVEFNLTDQLKFSSLTAHSSRIFAGRQDYTRYTPSVNFNTSPNPVNAFAAAPGYAAAIYPTLFPGGVINDPQNGAFNRAATSDLSRTKNDQWSQEVRLQSSFEGPWNFSLGAIYTRYREKNDYFVFLNTAVGYAQIQNLLQTGNPNCTIGPTCIAIDPNKDPNRSGHAYYDNFSPYDLTSYAGFGELYWKMTDTFKWTLGLRYTVDSKDVENHPVTLNQPGSGPGVPLPGQPTVLHAKFKKPTGRFGFDWKPDLGFTNETLVYAFYSRGYKAGGLNPPFSPGIGVAPTSPIFKPELIDSYEVGTKNTLLEGALQVNLTGFHYDYKDYQVSKIVNRTSINENIDAKIDGAEFESIWQPIEGLRLNAAIGWLHTSIGKASSIDTFNRTQGLAALTELKSSTASNCVTTTQAAATALAIANGQVPGFTPNPFALLGVCTLTSTAGAGLNLGGGAIAVGSNAFGGPVSEGVPINLSGNDLPNAPHWTVSLGAQYAMTFGDWDAVLRGDYYDQSRTYARIYNSDADRIKGWHNVNLTLTLQRKDWGLSVAGFIKNATNEKAITDFFLTDDSSGLFRNAFYTEPRTYGVALTKRW